MRIVTTSNVIKMQKNDEEVKENYAEIVHNPNYDIKQAILYNSAASTSFGAIGAGLAAGGVKSSNPQFTSALIIGGTLSTLASQDLNETNKNLKEKQKDWE